MTVLIFVGDKQLSVTNNRWWGFNEWVCKNAPDVYKSWKFRIDVIQSYVVNKNLPELKKHLEEVHSKIPDELKPTVEYLIKGVEYGIKNNYHFGVELTQEEIEVYKGEDKTPKNARGWNNKGDGLYSLGRYDEAVECYIKTIELAPKATETEAWNVDSGGNMPMLPKLSSMPMLSVQEATETEAWVDLDSLIGVTLFKKGMYDKMIEYCDRLLKLDPGKAMIWRNKAKALCGLERFDEAIESYRKYLKKFPDEIPMYGTWYLEEHLDEAEKCIRKYIKHTPDNVAEDSYQIKKDNEMLASSWSALGEKYRQEGWKKESDKCFKIAKRHREALHGEKKTVKKNKGKRRK